MPYMGSPVCGFLYAKEKRPLPGEFRKRLQRTSVLPEIQGAQDAAGHIHSICRNTGEYTGNVPETSRSGQKIFAMFTACLYLPR